MPRVQHRFAPDPANNTFLALLYRFFFFDWLFTDVAQARNVPERRAAWRHNLEMRKHLPTYLYRWGTVALATFAAGSLCDRVFEARLAASWCFAGFSLTLGIMAIIVASWLLLATSRTY